MRIPQDLLARIVDHARADAPNECCGVVSVRDDLAVEVYPLANKALSPKVSFKVEVDLAEAYDAMEAAGTTLGALYHSHPRTEAYPSLTDIGLSKPHWEGVEWIIVGLAGEEPKVRSFRIVDGLVREVPLEVE